MKTLYKTFYILTLSFCILNSVSAQPAGLSPDTATSVCNSSSPNTFWGFDSIGHVLKEFDITNNIIAYTGKSLIGCPGFSLAICTNLNSGSVSPTMYTSVGPVSYYWDGDTNWVQCNAYTGNIQNAGGADTNLYFFHTTSNYSILLRFNGTTYTQIYYTTALITMADIAVDNAGNIYFLTGPAAAYVLNVISSAGQFIAQFPFTGNLANAYGCFLLNSTLYVGVGSYNLVSPNTIIPLTIVSNTVIVGAPIALPTGVILTADLASCNPGLPLGINTVPFEQSFSIAPNPATENITITTAAISGTTSTVYNADGKMIVSPSTITSTTTTINVSHLPKGVYFIEIKNSTGIIKKKFARM